MRAPLRFWIAFAIVLVLALGQQASLLHDLRHATEQLGGLDEGVPAPGSCDEHFACAQLSGGGGTAPALSFHAPQPQRLFAAADADTVVSRAALPYRSRAPPLPSA